MSSSKEVPLFCDQCHYLYPTENTQQSLGVKDAPNHTCTLNHTKLIHGGWHPHILRQGECPDPVMPIIDYAYSLSLEEIKRREKILLICARLRVLIHEKASIIKSIKKHAKVT